MTNQTFVDSLRDLQVTAPAGLAECVMRTTGTGSFISEVSGPTGPLMTIWSSKGISRIVPKGYEGTTIEPHTAASGPTPAVIDKRIAVHLARTFATGRLGNLKLDLRALTDFQRRTLLKTAEIPPGEMRPYGWVAYEIESPRASRAVGSALRRNPLPIVLPCHRVGPSSGSVGQYAFGVDMKRQLLENEGTSPQLQDKMAEEGIRFIASRTTKIYCYPTCRHARRIKEEYQVPLSSTTESDSVGYRACKACRPTR